MEEDPARYIIPDPDMVPMLKRFREEGVQVREEALPGVPYHLARRETV